MLQAGAGAIERLFDVCPTNEIRLDRPIQRLLRDLIAFTRQGAMAPYVNWERYGRHLTGGTTWPRRCRSDAEAHRFNHIDRSRATLDLNAS